MSLTTVRTGVPFIKTVSNRYYLFQVNIITQKLTEVYLELFGDCTIQEVVVDSSHRRSGIYFRKNDFSTNNMRRRMSLSEILKECGISNPTKPVGLIQIAFNTGNKLMFKSELIGKNNDSQSSAILELHLDNTLLWNLHDQPSTLANGQVAKRKRATCVGSKKRTKQHSSATNISVSQSYEEYACVVED